MEYNVIDLSSLNEFRNRNFEHLTYSFTDHGFERDCGVTRSDGVSVRIQFGCPINSGSILV